MPLVSEKVSPQLSRRALLAGVLLAVTVTILACLLAIPIIHPLGVYPRPLRLAGFSVAGTWGTHHYLVWWCCLTDAEYYAVTAGPGISRAYGSEAGKDSRPVGYALRVGKLSWAVCRK